MVKCLYSICLGWKENKTQPQKRVIRRRGGEAFNQSCWQGMTPGEWQASCHSTSPSPWLQRLKCAVCKEKKKIFDKCMPAHRKYKKRSSKYRCEWQADCEWISLSVGLNTRQPAQFTMEDFLSVACGGLFWPEATLDGPVQLMQLTVLYSYWLVFTYSR